MNKTTRCTRECGAALLYAVIVAVVALLIVAAFGQRVIQRTQHVDRNLAFVDCYTGLEAGVLASAVDIERGGAGRIGLEGWSGEDDAAVPAWDDEGIDPQSSATLPEVEFIATAQSWQSDNIDNNGDGIVDNAEEDTYYTITSLARNRGVNRQVEVTAKANNVNVWDHALFGGPGRPDGVIAGDVDAHGSVFALGTDLPEGAVALGGLATTISNTYEGIPGVFDDRVPTLETRIIAGESLATLEAALRVKNGLVQLDGDSALGRETTSGEGLKKTLDATYVKDGWIGSLVQDDGDRGTPTTVFSDNGTGKSYDLGNRLDFPMLDDDYHEVGTGQTYEDPSTGKPASHQDYFSDALTGQAYPGDLVITTNQDFYFNATRPDDPDPGNLQPGDDYILFTAATNLLEVNGQLEVNGNFTIEPGSPDEEEYEGALEADTVYYKGRQALLVRGDATIRCSLLTGDAEVASTEVPFTIDGDTVRPEDNYTADVSVMGAAISYGGAYDMPVTARVSIGGVWSEPYGPYSSATDGNLNDGEVHPHAFPDPYSAGTSIGIQAQSWYQRYGGWRSYMSVNSWTGSDQVIVLRDGDPVPDIEPYLDQEAAATFVQDYIDSETQQIALLPNQAIFLFELGTTDLDSPAADFQDLVIVVSLFPPDMPPGEIEISIDYEDLPFPQNVLGIMAEDSITIGGQGEPLEVMGAFYAQNATTFEDNSSVSGAMVSGYFQTSTGVPSIYQVPALVDQLPEGMIWLPSFRVMDVLVWKELGVG